MQGYSVPSRLDSGVRYAMMFEELADGIRTIDFKAIGSAAELLQQAKIMECGANKQNLHIKVFPCLPAKLICPEEDAVRVIEEQRCTEFSKKSGGLASQLTIRNSVLYVLKLRRWCWHRENFLGRRNVGPACTDAYCPLMTASLGFEKPGLCSWFTPQVFN